MSDPAASVPDMDTTTFWELLELSRHETADQDERSEWLTAELAGRPPGDVADFQIHLDTAREQVDTWHLWAAAHLLCGGCSDDGFHYFQAWLIGLGHAGCTRITADPDALADVVLAADETPEWESLDYVAPEAYRLITGEPDGLDTALLARGHQVKGGPQPTGEGWDLDDPAEQARRLPRLSAAVHVTT